MRKILWIKQSFHIPYDMNLLTYESLFVDKKYKIQPLRLRRYLILQGPKVLVGTPLVMGTRGTGPCQVLEATCTPEQYCSRISFQKMFCSGLEQIGSVGFFYSFELLMVAQSFTIAKWVFITPDVI